MHIPFDELESMMRIETIPRPSVLWSSACDRWKRALQEWQIRRNPVALLRRFQPKIRLYIERHPYVVKTVESSWELESALKLRSRVFFEELLHRDAPEGLDLDSFDLACDHLVIIDQRSSRCVGTYRLTSSTFSNRFYASNEFQIDALQRLPGVKLELGRACIDKDYRTGAVIALLWSGVAQYLQKIDARYLFGCASVHTMDPVEIVKIQVYLQQHGHAIDDCDVPPLRGHRLEDHGLRYEGPALDAAPRKSIPPLLLSYLRMGALVAREPSVDRDFHCVDFLTLLDTVRLSASYERKFIRPESELTAS